MGTLRTVEYLMVQWAQYLGADRYTAHSGVLRVEVFAIFGFLRVHFAQCSSEAWSGLTIYILMGTVRTLQYCRLRWAQYLDTDGYIAHNGVLMGAVGTVFGC